MKPELVRFSSHPRPFRVETVHCTNLECECTEVTFHFRELVEDGKSTAEAMVFQVRLDGQTWEEIVPSHRLPEVARIVQEFLRDYPPGEREAIEKVSQEKSRIARRLQEYHIDPQWVEDGTLVAFGEIIYNRAGGRADGSSFLYSFEHEGEKYLVDDLYCPNPECHCHEVHLAFVRCAPSRRPGNWVVAEDRFLAQLSFDGRAKVAECERGTPGGAKAVLSAWQERYGDDLRELRWRYEKVKEIARRSVPGRTGVSRRCDLLPEENDLLGRTSSPAWKGGVRIARATPPFRAGLLREHVIFVGVAYLTDHVWSLWEWLTFPVVQRKQDTRGSRIDAKHRLSQNARS